MSGQRRAQLWVVLLAALHSHVVVIGLRSALDAAVLEEETDVVETDNDASATVRNAHKVDARGNMARTTQLMIKSQHLQVNAGEDKAIGLILIDYMYPTQPGDIDDKRSFCTVDENYECRDGFTIVPAMVQGLSFADAQKGLRTDGIIAAFEKALSYLLATEKVMAIIGNCGFLANYQEFAESYVEYWAKTTGKPAKPVKLSSMSLAPVLTNSWSLSEDQEVDVSGAPLAKRVVIYTANKGTLKHTATHLVEKLGVKGIPGEGLSMEDIHNNRQNLVSGEMGPLTVMTISEIQALQLREEATVNDEMQHETEVDQEVKHVLALEEELGKRQGVVLWDKLKASLAERRSRVNDLYETLQMAVRVYTVLKHASSSMESFCHDTQSKITRMKRSYLSALTGSATEVEVEHGWAAFWECVRHAFKRVNLIGARDVAGFGQEVNDGEAHMLVSATPHVVGKLQGYITDMESREHVRVMHVILECTELPAYSNAIRLATGKPVWDVTTLAHALMESVDAGHAHGGWAPKAGESWRLVGNDVLDTERARAVLTAHGQADWIDPHFGVTAINEATGAYDLVGAEIRAVQDYQEGPDFD